MYQINLNEQEMAVVAKAIMALKITGKDAQLVSGVITKLQQVASKKK